MEHHTETERKWILHLADAEALKRSASESYDIEQCYFGAECRVRINRGDITNAVISFKVKLSELTRKEYNFPIPVEDAEDLISRSPLTIVKRRFDIGDGFTLDEFFNGLYGFHLIEKEYESEEAANNDVVPSHWDFGVTDVTSDDTYKNEQLVHLTWDDAIGLFKDDQREIDNSAQIDNNDIEHLIKTGDVDDNMPDPLIIR